MQRNSAAGPRCGAEPRQFCLRNPLPSQSKKVAALLSLLLLAHLRQPSQHSSASYQHATTMAASTSATAPMDLEILLPTLLEPLQKLTIPTSSSPLPSSSHTLLALKPSLLHEYTQGLLLLHAHRLRGLPLDSGEGAELVKTLITLRLCLEKTRPLEAKARAGIDRLLRAAEQGEKESAREGQSEGAMGASSSAAATETAQDEGQWSTGGRKLYPRTSDTLPHPTQVSCPSDPTCLRLRLLREHAPAQERKVHRTTTAKKPKIQGLACIDLLDLLLWRTRARAARAPSNVDARRRPFRATMPCWPT